MLEVKKLKKRFGSNVVLNDISFNVSKGDIISIVGPSGVVNQHYLDVLI